MGRRKRNSDSRRKSSLPSSEHWSALYTELCQSRELIDQQTERRLLGICRSEGRRLCCRSRLDFRLAYAKTVRKRPLDSTAAVHERGKHTLKHQRTLDSPQGQEDKTNERWFKPN